MKRIKLDGCAFLIKYTHPDYMDTLSDIVIAEDMQSALDAINSDKYHGILSARYIGDTLIFTHKPKEKTKYDHYPKTWKAKPEALDRWVKRNFNNGKSFKEIAIASRLLDNDNDPVNAIGGGKIDPAALLSELLEIPKPLINLD